MIKQTVKDILSSMRQLAFDFFEETPPSQPKITPVANPKVPSHETFFHEKDFTLTPGFSYRLERSKRKTVGFIINENGLTIRAPRWVSVAEIEKMIQEKEGWIQKNLEKVSQRAQQTERQKVRFTDGAVLPYLGSDLQIELSAKTSWLEPVDQGFRLHVDLPKDADEEQVRQWLLVWFKKAALSYMDERIKRISAQANVSYRQWGLSNAKARWGSCSADGRIRLNWRLIHLAPSMIDYVIAHELAHLSEMNHSDRFWLRVAEIYPHYEKEKLALKSIFISSLPFER